MDPGVEYRDCDLSHYEDEFDIGMTTEQFYEKCWRVANVDPADEAAGRVAVFVDDGDLVMRIDAKDGGAHLEWRVDDQGPLAYQRLAGDFVVIARLEALHPVDANHCLEPGNVAGLVVRSVENPSEWVSYFMGPDNPTLMNCMDTEVLPPETSAAISSSAGGAPTTVPPNIGVLGDAYLSICRVASTMDFAFKDPMSMNDTPTWIKVDTPFTVAGAVDVGPALSARIHTQSVPVGDGFQIEGHFDWIAYANAIGADGCLRAREGIVLPPPGS